MACLSPRDSAKLIYENSQSVEIDRDAVSRLAKSVSELIATGQYRQDSWNTAPLHPKEANDEAVAWIFLVDSLNFSFWTPDEAKYRVTFQGQSQTGYWALCAAVNRAIQEGIPITSAEYMSRVTLDQVGQIFRSDDPAITIPLLTERRDVMNSVGQTLLQDFGGSFVNCVVQCQGSALKLVETVVDKFPSFRDRALFQGQTVSFYKRAQILAGDLWSCFDGRGLGSFGDIDRLTMFADYRVPQVLVHFGVLKYKEDLMEKLRKEDLLENGSREEVEIRGCSVWAVELLRQELEGLGHSELNSVRLDFYLWDYRRRHSLEVDSAPYHRTRSIYY